MITSRNTRHPENSQRFTNETYHCLLATVVVKEQRVLVESTELDLLHKLYYLAVLGKRELEKVPLLIF
jgi:hypothetical protein